MEKMRIYVIIVLYNPDFNLLVRQHKSLYHQVNHIIYVDNGSDNISLIKSKFEDCKTSFIFNGENRGLGYAQNIGIKKAKDYGAEYVLLFDQDSIPPVNFVKNLTSVFNKASETYQIGLVGPAIRNAYKDISKNMKGIIISGLGFSFVELKKITEVSYCIASGSLIPISVLNRVGLLEEKLFIDGLDLEWCLRAKNLGYDIIQTDQTYLEHQLGNGKSNKVLSHSPMREYFIIRNDIWLSRQHYIPFGYRCRKKLSPFLRLLYSFVHFSFDYTKVEIKGIYDGFKL